MPETTTEALIRDSEEAPIEAVNETSELAATPETPAVAQFLSVIKYNGDRKGLLVILADGSVDVLELDQPEASVENYLLDQLNRKQIAIDKSSLAAFQLKAMLMDAEDQLPLVEAPKCKEIRAKYIEINTPPEYVDSARVADTIIIPIVENNQVKEFLSTVKALAQALVDAQLSEAKGNNCLLLPFQGDLTVDSPRVTILLAGLLTDEHQPKVDLSVPAGEKVLKMIVTLLMNDVAPRNGGQREPYIERLITYCEVTPQEFCEEILKKISEKLQEQNVGKLKIFLKLNSIRSQLQTNLTSVQAILDAAKSGLTDGGFIKKNKPDAVEELVLKATSSLSLSILLETMLGNALVDESGIRYKPAGILEEVRELGAALQGNEPVPDQATSEAEQFTQPLPNVEPMAPPPTQPRLIPTEPVASSRPSVRERLFGAPKVQQQKMEIPQSTYGEIGSQVEMHKEGGGLSFINVVVFSKESRWPLIDSFDKRYVGPEMIFSLISAPQETTLLNIEASGEIQLQVNGRVIDIQNNRTELKPGDILKVTDVSTNSSSTFAYGFTKKFELLATNQVGVTAGEYSVPAAENPGNVEGFEIIGYVITDELNQRNSFTDYPQFNKTITWGDFGTLDYHCGMSFSRKLTLSEKKGASDSKMALVASRLQGSVPLIPINQSQELSIGSHVIAEDRQHNTIAHLRVLASGLIVTYTEKRPTIAQAAPARVQTRVEPKQSVTQISVENKGDTTVFDTPQNAEFGPRISINLLQWNTEPMSFDDTTRVRLIAFGDPNTKPDQVKFNQWSQFALTLKRKHDRSSGDRELRVTTFPEASLDQEDAQFSVNGKLWDKRGQFSIQPGDVFSVSEPISGIRSTFVYDYLGTSLELLQTEHLDDGHSNRVKSIENLPAPCEILGYIGKVSRTRQRPDAPDNIQKDIHWAETSVKVLSEADRFGTHVVTQLVDFDFGRYSFTIKSAGKSNSVPIHSSRYLPIPGDQIDALDKKTGIKYSLNILASGLIVSFVEEHQPDAKAQESIEPEAGGAGEVIYFPRSKFAEVGANLKFTRVAPPAGENGVKQFVLSDQEPWPLTKDIGEKYEGFSMTIELHSKDELNQRKYYVALTGSWIDLSQRVSVLINGSIWNDLKYIPLFPGDVISFGDKDTQSTRRTSFVLTRSGTLEFVNSNHLQENKTLCVENEFTPTQKSFEVIGYLDGGALTLEQRDLAKKLDNSIFWDEIEPSGAFIHPIKHFETTFTIFGASTSTKLEFKKVSSNNPRQTEPLDDDEPLGRGDHVIATDKISGTEYHLEILKSGLVVKYTTNAEAHS